MSNKEIVEDLLRRLPESASLHDIAREIEFVAGVKEGLAVGERIATAPSRLARECAKLSKREEQAFAEESFRTDAQEWPAY